MALHRCTPSKGDPKRILSHQQPTSSQMELCKLTRKASNPSWVKPAGGGAMAATPPAAQPMLNGGGTAPGKRPPRDAEGTRGVGVRRAAGWRQEGKQEKAGRGDAGAGATGTCTDTAAPGSKARVMAMADVVRVWAALRSESSATSRTTDSARQPLRLSFSPLSRYSHHFIRIHSIVLDSECTEFRCRKISCALLVQTKKSDRIFSHADLIFCLNLLVAMHKFIMEKVLLVKKLPKKWLVINLESLLLHVNLLPLSTELRPRKQKSILRCQKMLEVNINTEN